MSVEAKSDSVMLRLKSKQRVQVSWRDITYDVLTPAGSKRILFGCSAHASPAAMLAIMGSSGAGKTTLLNCLSGRFRGGNLSGTISGNGAPILDRKIFRRVAAFVTQDDLMLETQTPREVLHFSAALRLPPSTTRAERKAIVEDVIQLLHLGGAADTLVGDPSTGGISGGERKRVNIGAEMVTNPSVIYVDEPAVLAPAARPPAPHRSHESMGLVVKLWGWEWGCAHWDGVGADHVREGEQHESARHLGGKGQVFEFRGAVSVESGGDGECKLACCNWRTGLFWIAP